MVGNLRAAVAGLILLSVPVVSQASGWGPVQGGWSGPGYCGPGYPATAYPVYPMPRPTMPPAMAWPMAPTYPSAVPRPAPPSRGPAVQTPEPPRAAPEKKRAPIVNEARSQGGEYAAKKTLDKNVCKVGFWNATGRDVQLVVDGQTRTLARDRAITLDVARTFAWQVDDGRPRNEQVPTGQSTFEVVIRP